MIDINLIPDEKGRRRKRRGILPAGFVLPREVVIGLVGGFLVLLALWHVLLQMVIVVKYVQLKSQQSRWEGVISEKKEVDLVIKELRARQERVKAIESIKGGVDIFWAEKLQAISDVLLRGVWLRRFALEDGNVLINGSAVSKHKLEMISVHNFVAKLKEDPSFMKGISAVELESIKSRKVGEISVADFVIRIVMEAEDG